MRINFAGTDLADYSTFPPQAVAFNGQAAFEAVEVIRAAQKTFRYRGNDAVQLGFSVTRIFATMWDAEIFLLTHFTGLPKSGLCTCYCGASDSTATPVFLANAILTAVPTIGYDGCSVAVSYTIMAPAATLTTPVGYITGGGSTMTLQGNLGLAATSTYLDVPFSTAFTVAPSVSVGIIKPSGGDNLFGVPRNVTAFGFSVDFDAPIPATGYLLSWIAAGN